MAHQWQEYQDPALTPVQRLMGNPQRRCALCGAIQTQQTEYLWMRVHRRLWRPLAGRCKPTL